MAARHLWQFGYRPTCLYPKPTPRQLFTNLVEQCKQLDIEFLASWPGREGLGESKRQAMLWDMNRRGLYHGRDRVPLEAHATSALLPLRDVP